MSSNQLNILENLDQLNDEINNINNNIINFDLAQCIYKLDWIQQQFNDVNNAIIILQDYSEKLNAQKILVTDKIEIKNQEAILIEEENKKARLAEIAQAVQPIQTIEITQPAQSTQTDQPIQSTQTCKTIDELCGKIDNLNQVAILNRIVSDKEYSKIYLSGYNPNIDFTGKKKHLLGSVIVLGTYNEKKQCREEYEIKLYKEDPKGMFWCSCADHKFNSTKKNIVCKHICFLICKIGKFMKPDIFTNKKLSDDDLALLLAKIQSSGDIWKDQTIAKLLDKITLDTFKQFLKAIDDCCPVCFNDLSDDDKPQLLSCPTCKNYIHEECADIWLEQRACCALCKSDYWKYYGKVKAGGSISVKNIV